MNRKLRWWIGGLLFASTVINYIDRQTVNVLGPYLKTEYHWNNEDFALVVVAFRIAYALGPTFAGRFLDRVGTRRGLSITVLWYSAAAMLTSFATGLRSLCAFRFLLGLGESANWPGATKAVAEWFSDRERALAVALFDSGSAVGAAVAPFLVVALYHRFGGWRPAFVLTGCLGLLWVVSWRGVYREPKGASLAPISAATAHWTKLLRFPQTWGIIIGKLLTDPVWYFISDWFAIYLVSRGVKLEQGIVAFWIPFLAADLGNFAGGGLSSWLVARRWSVLNARKAVILVGGFGMTLLIPAIYVSKRLHASCAVRRLDVLLCGMVHHGYRPSIRFISERDRSHRRGHEQHRCGNRHHCLNAADRLCFGPLLIRADPCSRQLDSARRHRRHFLTSPEADTSGHRSGSLQSLSDVAGVHPSFRELCRPLGTALSLPRGFY